MRFIPETDAQAIRAHLDKKLQGPVTPRAMNQWHPIEPSEKSSAALERIPDVRFHQIRNSRGIAGSAAETVRQPRHAALDHASPESQHIDGSGLALWT